jgi:hypothetical protein
MTIPAKYENGVFRPLQGLTLDEGTVVEVQIPDASLRKRRPLRDLGFAGMWADRGDIVDGVSYVDRLRDKSPQF